MKVNLVHFAQRYYSQSNNKTRNDKEVNQNNDFSMFHNYAALLNKGLINFCGKEKSFSEQLEERLEKSNNDELFEFLDEKLRQRAEDRKIAKSVIDDVVQNAMVEMLITLNDFNDSEINKQELIEKINNIYENLKATREDYATDLRTKSLQEKLANTDNAIEYFIPDDEDHRIKYLKKADNKTKEKYKKELEKVLENVDLKDRERQFLSERYSNTGKTTYRELGEKYGIKLNTARKIIQGTLRKIQIANNKLPKEIQENIEELVKRFNSEGLTYKKYLQACVGQPQLFEEPAEKTEKKVRDLVEKFEKEGLTVEDYLHKACLKQPPLFYQSPDTIESNVRDLVKKFENEGLTVKDYLYKACLKQAQLFTQSPDTIEKNVRDLAKKFEKEGLTVKDYLHKACLKQPQLFCQSPDTIESNVRDLAKKFEKEGLTVEDYLHKACLKQPPLFYQSPDTIESNVRDLVKKFENEGLTVKDYLYKACLKQAQLFYQSPETIADHIKAILFVNKNYDKDLSQDEIWKKVLAKPLFMCCTNKTNYSYLLRKQMFPHKNPKGLSGSSKINQKIIDYLKANPDLSFSFSIIKDEMSNEFIEYTKKLGFEATGRNDVFNIIVEN